VWLPAVSAKTAAEQAKPAPNGSPLTPLVNINDEQASKV